MAYEKHTVGNISLALLVIGLLMLVTGILSFVFATVTGWPRAFTPLWTAILAIAIGSVGLHASRNDRVYTISKFFRISNMVLIFSSIVCFITVITDLVRGTDEFVFETHIAGVILFSILVALAFASLITSGIAVSSRANVPERVVVIQGPLPHVYTSTSPPIVTNEPAFTYSSQPSVPQQSSQHYSSQPSVPQQSSQHYLPEHFRTVYN
ncbi:uncharacterized protein LOC102807563 [Saccoglossus kowalevskii]|uniref:Uncharacterized protein LOC102807563 n=1 Tax=Saccoglossus kowalevskii TaxID=10224 RepID=A0ABM0M5W0_SACKO|nr:PREDICTED: uncharacterized protein LOC102807563 [Saccoglossus kowalevskii]